MIREYWNRFLRWRGWRLLFPMPVWAALSVFIACCIGLIWVFIQNLTQWWPAYILYGLSAYSLTALCIKLPAAAGRVRGWMGNHPRVAGVLKNRELKFTWRLYIKQFLNFAYGIFKIVSGTLLGSAWIGADGIYNLAQASIQLFQILRRKHAGTLRRQWSAYRSCGVLILLMHLTLIGIVFQTVNWNRAEEAGEIMVIATAAFAFYKCISAFVNLAKDRKHIHPVDSSVRLLELSQAFFAIFSLQAEMLRTFGTGEGWEQLLNLAVGCAVCMLTVAMGIYMIRRANREIQVLQEKNNGK